MKRFIAVVLVVLVCAGLFASCSGTTDKIGEEVSKLTGEVKVKMEGVLDSIKTWEHKEAGNVETALNDLKAEVEKVEAAIGSKEKKMNEAVKTALDDIKSEIVKIETDIKDGKLKEWGDQEAEAVKQKLSELKTNLVAEFEKIKSK